MSVFEKVVLKKPIQEYLDDKKCFEQYVKNEKLENFSPYEQKIIALLNSGWKVFRGQPTEKSNKRTYLEFCDDFLPIRENTINNLFEKKVLEYVTVYYIEDEVEIHCMVNIQNYNSFCIELNNRN